MLKQQKLIVGLIATVFLLGACDEVNGPYRDPDSYGNSGGPVGDRVQKILLEEFTGFRCRTCPAATEIAADIKARNEDQVILISVHSGFFAETGSGSSPFTYDFRTPVGDQLDDKFDVNAPGTPNALINRSDFNNSKVVGPGDWRSSVNSLLEQEAPMTIEVSSDYNDATNTVSVDATVTYFENGGANDYIAVYLIENNFVQVQVDERKTPNIVENYVHQHVLRASFNGTWGEPVAAAAASAGDEIEKSWTLTINPDEWNPDELEVVVMVHDFQGTDRILQVEAAHVGE